MISADSPSPASAAAGPFALGAAVQGLSENVNDVGARTRELVLGPASCPWLQPSGIGLVGSSDARVGFRFERLDPPFVQILACLSGEGEVYVGGQWLRCGEGQAYITPQRQPHAYRALPSGMWRLVWIMYGEDSVTLDEPPVVKVADTALLEATFLGLYREFHATAEPAVMASWTHLVDTTARRMFARQLHDPRMTELWETIAADMARTWTLEEMAKVAHLSPEHLRRLCHATYHRSPMRHLTYLRMRHAAELLALTDQKIEAVGRQVGYDNAFAFSSAFKREIGTAPSSCRGSRAR